MNKRQAKKDIHPHGSWSIEREIQEIIKPLKMLPRWRQRYKWRKQRELCLKVKGDKE